MGSSLWGKIPYASLLENLISGIEVDRDGGGTVSMCITYPVYFLWVELDSLVGVSHSSQLRLVVFVFYHDFDISYL